MSFSLFTPFSATDVERLYSLLDDKSIFESKGDTATKIISPVLTVLTHNVDIDTSVKQAHAHNNAHTPVDIFAFAIFTQYFKVLFAPADYGLYRHYEHRNFVEFYPSYHHIAKSSREVEDDVFLANLFAKFYDFFFATDSNESSSENSNAHNNVHILHTLLSMLIRERRIFAFQSFQRDVTLSHEDVSQGIKDRELRNLVYATSVPPARVNYESELLGFLNSMIRYVDCTDNANNANISMQELELLASTHGFTPGDFLLSHDGYLKRDGIGFQDSFMLRNFDFLYQRLQKHS